MSKFFHCYILYSKSTNTTYVGYTSDLSRRLSEHLVSPTRTTSRAKDWELVWTAAFISKPHAESFERFLKSGNGRIFMRKRLIGNLSESD